MGHLGRGIVNPLIRSHKFRSNFELGVVAAVSKHNVKVEYETKRIQYVIPPKIYTPDFYFPDYDLYVECKGFFRMADRKKHLLIKEQCPELDIRFVFVRADNKLSSKSKTTYGGWCEKNGFIYSEKFIPKEWFNENNI